MQLKGLSLITSFFQVGRKVFPSQRSIDEGGLAGLEEERRLAYVGITRAKRRCVIFHAANRRIMANGIVQFPHDLSKNYQRNILNKKQPFLGAHPYGELTGQKLKTPFQMFHKKIPNALYPVDPDGSELYKLVTKMEFQGNH